MAKPSRYKYFSCLKYAHRFLEGKVFFQTAAFFRDYEDAKAQQVIGDEYECTRLYRPPSGLEINNMTRGTNGTIQMGMECHTKADEIYIFCVSLSFNDRLREEFGAVACVEILQPKEFIRRWQHALPDEARGHTTHGYPKHVARKLGYYRAGDGPDNVWALPDLITTTKLEAFKYQDEYRFAFTKTDAFEFQNCRYELVDRKHRPLPKPEEHHSVTLELGDLREICTLHEF
jgi:hypothetical protein